MTAVSSSVTSPLRVASGAPFWLLRHGLMPVAECALPARADIVIVGAGITGAMLADTFIRAGRSVVILERHGPAEGSTSVSTALLQYELDVELVPLAGMLGDAAAGHAYRRCAEAIDELATLTDSLGDDCDFVRATSIYLGRRRRDVKRLRVEAEARARAGLDVRWLSREEVDSRYGVKAHAALETLHAATVDPVRLTRALLQRAVAGGATLCVHTPLVQWTDEGTGVRIMTGRGQCTADALVFATGYEVPAELPDGLVTLHSTYALVTQPVHDTGPLRGGTMFWETARPYTYLRTTPDGRILAGGMDVPFRNPDARDALLPARTRALEKQVRAFFGGQAPDTAFAWAGTFGETRDGLPYIGRIPGHARAFVALGYGGNGIVFSRVAADVLGTICLGGTHPDEALFGFERLTTSG